MTVRRGGSLPGVTARVGVEFGLGGLNAQWAHSLSPATSDRLQIRTVGDTTAQVITIGGKRDWTRSSR